MPVTVAGTRTLAEKDRGDQKERFSGVDPDPEHELAQLEVAGQATGRRRSAEEPVEEEAGREVEPRNRSDDGFETERYEVQGFGAARTVWEEDRHRVAGLEGDREVRIGLHEDQRAD